MNRSGQRKKTANRVAEAPRRLSKNPGNRIKAHVARLRRVAALGSVTLRELAERACESDDQEIRAAGLRILGATVI